MKKEQPYMHKIIDDAEMNLSVQGTKLAFVSAILKYSFWIM